MAAPFAGTENSGPTEFRTFYHPVRVENEGVEIPWKEEGGRVVRYVRSLSSESQAGSSTVLPSSLLAIPIHVMCTKSRKIFPFQKTH